MFSGEEFYWNVGAAKTSGAVQSFRFVMSSDGTHFDGASVHEPDHANYSPWWGDRSSCVVNPNAEKLCNYPK